MDRNLSINYHLFPSTEDLCEEDKILAKAAQEAAQSAYAPYSGFQVGAAVRLADGVIVKGSNQENAAYPSGICAERVAMFSAAAQYPDIAFASIAIVGMASGKMTEGPTTPCGACRQVMAEYQKKGGSPISVICCGAKSVVKFDSIDDLLPFSFEL